MWCPAGYYTLNEISGLCGLAASNATQHRVSEGVYKVENNIGFQQGDLFQIKKWEEEFLHTWLLASFLREMEPLICTRESLLFRATGLICHHEDEVGCYDWIWPHTASEHEKSIYADSFLGYYQIKNGNHPIARFRFIDPITGTISIRDRERELRLISHDNDEDTRAQITTLMPFDGLPICFLAEDTLDNPKEVLDFFDVDSTSPTSSRVSVSSKPRMLKKAVAGRPLLQGLAGPAYWSIYPSGHGDTPWTEVEDEIEATLGRRVSYKTIKRAIASKLDNLNKVADKNADKSTNS